MSEVPKRHIRPPKPLGNNVRIILDRSYIPETDEGYEEHTFLQARNIAQGDTEKADKVYQELRRTMECMRLIDTQTEDSDRAKELIDTLIRFEGMRIEAILNPVEPALPHERQ